VDAAVRLVAAHYHGPRGVWAYEAFDFINAAYFAGALPTSAISWALTPHGGCLGYTQPNPAAPLIVLHPSLLGGTERRAPWGEDPALLGVRYAFDVLIHECIHVQVAHGLGGWHGHGDTSHNNAQWIGEVNRLAPRLGLAGVVAGRSVSRREPVAGAPPTVRGKPPTKVVRGTVGNVPFRVVATFPVGLRAHRGDLAVYRQDTLPFTPSVGIGRRNMQLDVTEPGDLAAG